MKLKVQQTSEKLAAIISDWPGVEAIILEDSAEGDTLDPYFSLNLDVFYNGPLPSSKEREAQFSSASLFESSVVQKKDRFLFDEMPVFIEYKATPTINDVLENGKNGKNAFLEEGTFIFYKLMNNMVLFEDGTWLKDIKSQLTDLPEAFWEFFRKSAVTRMETSFSNLSASVITGDMYLNLRESAAFIQTTCNALFAVNKTFDPPARKVFSEVKKLEKLPEGFAGRLESFLRTGQELGPDRKKEIADHIARSIVTL